MLAVALSQLLKDVWDGYGGQTVFVISGDVAVYNDAASSFLLANLDSPSAAFSGASILSALNASNGRHVVFICNIKQMYQNFASIAYNALRLPTIFVYTQGDKVKQCVRTRSSARELPQDYMKYTPLSWQAIKAPLAQSSRHPYGAVIFTGPSFPAEREVLYVPPFVPSNVDYDWTAEAAQVAYQYLYVSQLLYTQTYHWAVLLAQVAAQRMGGATVIWRDEHSEILFNGAPDLMLYVGGQL